MVSLHFTAKIFPPQISRHDFPATIFPPRFSRHNFPARAFSSFFIIAANHFRKSTAP
jgi:hypothetical protein